MTQINIAGRVFILVKCEVCSSVFKRRKSSKAKNNSCRSCLPKLRSKNTSVDKLKPDVCVDCLCSVYRGSVRCRKCSYKHRTKADKLCVDCGKKINRKAVGRCLPCHNKKQDKGLSKERTKFNASSKWAKIRVKCFERDSYTCQYCGEVGGTLNAHHIKHYATHKRLRLDINNIVTVCVPCHRRIHFG